MLLPALARAAEISSTAPVEPAAVPAAGAPPAGPDPARPSLESAYRESGLRRTENVFFISLPFTALYSAILTGTAALLIERGDIRHPDLYLGISVGLAASASALIAWRDSRAPAPAPPPVMTGGAPESGTILLDSPR